MKIVVKNPNQAAFITEAINLEDFQKIVGGYVEVVQITDDVILLCNEDGLSQKLPDNCGYAGAIVFVGVKEDDWKSLTENDTIRAIKWCEKHNNLRVNRSTSIGFVTGDKATKAARVDAKIDAIARKQEWQSLTS